MNATQTTTPTAPQVKPLTGRGFPGLRCISCGETDCVALCLADVTAFTCTSCDAEFSADEVHEHLMAWHRVMAWIGQAPEVEG
jgi:hypothetical protein